MSHRIACRRILHGRCTVPSLLIWTGLLGHASAQAQLGCDPQTLPYAMAYHSIFDAGHATAQIGHFEPPPEITLPPACQMTITVSRPGGLACVAGAQTLASADGSTTIAPLTDIQSARGISGIVLPGAMALVGVFLGASEPQVDSTPPRLDFTQIGTNFESLAPQLNQSFFVGDGRTGTGAGTFQRFVAPPGAVSIAFGWAYAPGYIGAPCCHDDHRCPPVFQFPYSGIGGSMCIAIDEPRMLIDPYITGVAMPSRASSDCPSVWETATAYMTVWNPASPSQLNYRWRKGGVPLVDGPTPHGSTIVGTTTSQIRVLDAKLADEGSYDCLVWSSCQAPRTTPPVQLTVCTGRFQCAPASGFLHPPDSLFRFLQLWFEGDHRADVNESGTVTVQDVFDFLAAFFGPTC